MGTFLTNIQLYIGDKKSQDVYPQVRDALMANLSETYEIVEDSELATRTIFIAPCSSRWISIYDQDSEMQEVRILRQLARSLSKTLKSNALSVMVHDSDVLWLDLFSVGKKVDSYCSNVGLLEEGGKGLPVKHEKGDPEKWKQFLSPGKKPKDLKQAWAAEYTFADEMLAELAGLFGVDGDKLGVGYNILDSMKQLPPNVERLHFRSRRPVAPKPADFEFKLIDIDLVRSVSPGQSVVFSATIKNKGMSSKGVGVHISGEATEVTHLKPIRCWAGIGMPLSEKQPPPKGAQSEFLLTSDEGRPAWTAEIPEIQFPGNPKGTEDRMLTLGMEFSAISVGSDDLIIMAFPLENPDRGYSSMNIGIRVRLPDAY